MSQRFRRFPGSLEFLLQRAKRSSLPDRCRSAALDTADHVADCGNENQADDDGSGRRQHFGVRTAGGISRAAQGSTLSIAAPEAIGAAGR